MPTHTRRKLGLGYRLTQIAKHNQDIATLGMLSDLWDIGIVVPFHPAKEGIKTIDVFGQHISKDRDHLRRWTFPMHPEPFLRVFGTAWTKMDALRRLNEHGMGRFKVTVQTKMGPVWIIGDIMHDGSLLPNSIIDEGGSVDYSRGRPTDITKMLDDPYEADPGIKPMLARTLKALRTMGL